MSKLSLAWFYKGGKCGSFILINKWCSWVQSALCAIQPNVLSGSDVRLYQWALFHITSCSEISLFKRMVLRDFVSWRSLVHCKEAITNCQSFKSLNTLDLCLEETPIGKFCLYIDWMTLKLVNCCKKLCKKCIVQNGILG